MFGLQWWAEITATCWLFNRDCLWIFEMKSLFSLSAACLVQNSPTESKRTFRENFSRALSSFLFAWLILPPLLPPPYLQPLPMVSVGKCPPKTSPSQSLLPFRVLPRLPSLCPSPALWQHCLAVQLGPGWWLPWWWRCSHQKGINPSFDIVCAVTSKHKSSP